MGPDYLRCMSASEPAAALSDPDLPEPSVADLSGRLSERLVHLARLVHGGASEHDLTPAQWTALRYFARANRFSRTPSAFSEFHATTRGTASQTVKSLIALGLLERHASDTDRRSTRIEVTPAGHARLSDDPLASLTEAIAALPDPERRAMAATLDRLTTAMTRTRATPVFGDCEDCSHCDTSRPGPAYCRCTQTLLDQAEMSALCVDFAPRLR